MKNIAGQCFVAEVVWSGSGSNSGGRTPMVHKDGGRVQAYTLGM